MNFEPKVKKLVRKILILVLVIIIVGIGYWVSGFSFIQATIKDDGVSGNFDFKVTNEEGESSSTSSSKTFRKLVRKGSYIVSANQNSKNAFSPIIAKGLFQTTKVELSLGSEKQANFIGDNPLSCMEYKEMLVSYICNGQAEKLQAHIPANEKAASKIQKLDAESIFGYKIVGDIRLEDKNYFFGVLELDGGTELSLVEVIDSGGQASLGSITRIVNKFSRDTDKFIIEEFRTGFLIYSPDKELALFYNSVSDQTPENIEFPKTTASALSNIYSIDFRDDKVLATYSDVAVAESPNVSYKPSVPNISPEEVHTDEVFEDEESHEGKATIVIKQSTVVTIELDSIPDQVRFCGTSFICVLTQGELAIYDIRNKPKLLLNLPDVTQIESVDDRVLMVRPDGVVDFDLATNQGYYQYYFGDYVYCGAEFTPNQTLLCIENDINGARSSSIILLNTNQNKVDDIDKQILQLSKSPLIKLLAVYKNFIHISGDYGELTINPVSGDFGYNPDTVRSINSEITKDIQEHKINTNRYIIINPIQ